ncbi:MAG: DUF3108 domain-containing protein [Ignavibacteria bacterium]|jgi:hypothetical protein|nr:DUF3108 domain-containing protein [Ignavibacteria bacterium]
MKQIIFILTIICSYVSSFAGVIQVGEELIYDVSYLSFKLGSIKIITLPDTIINNEKVHHSKVFIQSNPNIPFYSLKSIFNSYMDTSLTEGRYFECNSKEQDQLWGFQKITFRDKYSSNPYIRNIKYYDNKVLNDTSYYISEKILDGSTLFFYARKNAHKTMKVKLPTVMDLSIANTYINFTGKMEKVSIALYKNPVQCYYIEGNGDWSALYGLGGKFKGWFTDDDAHIPIKAQMNVYLGSINIELKSVKR